MPKKPEQNLEVGYFRSRNLSICSLFNIDRHDAALLFAHMELIDDTYTEKVNIEKFAAKFFPDGKYVFQLLWSYFVIIFKDSRLGLGSTSYINNISMARAASIEGKSSNEDKEHGSYVELVAFLYMIVSVDKKHFTHFLFWLVYIVNEEAKSRRGLVAIASKLWKLDKAYIDKNKHKERAMYMALVKSAVKHLEASALDMKTFQIYDFRVQTAFSIPLKRMQAEILKKIGNKKFWTKGKAELSLILSDPAIVVLRMGELNSGGKSYRSTGDRKYAWFEVRDYIEAFFRFHEAANAIVIEPATIWQKLKKKLFPPRVKESTIVPVNLETCDAVTAFSMVEKVDARKAWPVIKYYEEADNNRDDALKMLELAQEELDEPLPDIFNIENDESAGGVRMKRSNQDGSMDEDSDDDDRYSKDSG
mmetsp:Transcript_15353/g.28897  ORF Transcript_15353/g.28897 Transcript_15353/m.28897 type:complete len:419 (+) Transcript_15353:149-1405(+)